MSVFHPESNAVERRNFVLFPPFKYRFPLGYLINNCNNKRCLFNTDSLIHYTSVCIATDITTYVFRPMQVIFRPLKGYAGK
jgi:hypothetical protein